MVTVDVGAIWCKVRGLSGEESERLSNYLSYEVQGHFFSEAYQRGFWDGRRRLINRKTGVFQAGLTARVVHFLRKKGIEFSLDTSKLPRYTFRPFELQGVQLRDYQEKAIQRILKRRRGVVELPPRSGKTLIFAGLQAATGLTPALFTCPQIDILQQSYKTFEKVFPSSIKMGVLQGQNQEIGDLTICTTQTLLSRLKREDSLVLELLEKVKLVGFDEVHHVASGGNQILLKGFPAAEFVAGFSATAFREDGSDLLIEQAIGPKVFHLDYSYLIAAGYLARPTFHILSVRPPRERYPSQKKQAYARAYEQEIIHHNERNALICKCARKLRDSGKTCIITVTRLEHGRLLAESIDQSIFLHAKSEDREQILEELRERKRKVVVSTLLDEGVDIPSLDATIIACAGKSAIKAFQRLRCLTKTPTKKTCIVVDFADPGRFFKRHCRRRLELYNSEEEFKIVRH